MDKATITCRLVLQPVVECRRGRWRWSSADGWPVALLLCLLGCLAEAAPVANWPGYWGLETWQEVKTVAQASGRNILFLSDLPSCSSCLSTQEAIVRNQDLLGGHVAWGAERARFYFPHLLGDIASVTIAAPAVAIWDGRLAKGFPGGPGEEWGSLAITVGGITGQKLAAMLIQNRPVDQVAGLTVAGGDFDGHAVRLQQPEVPLVWLPPAKATPEGWNAWDGFVVLRTDGHVNHASLQFPMPVVPMQITIRQLDGTLAQVGTRMMDFDLPEPGEKLPRNTGSQPWQVVAVLPAGQPSRADGSQQFVDLDSTLRPGGRYTYAVYAWRQRDFEVFWNGTRDWSRIQDLLFCGGESIRVSIASCQPLGTAYALPGNRQVELAWESPVGPSLALGGAVLLRGEAGSTFPAYLDDDLDYQPGQLVDANGEITEAPGPWPTVLAVEEAAPASPILVRDLGFGVDGLPPGNGLPNGIPCQYRIYFYGRLADGSRGGYLAGQPLNQPPPDDGEPIIPSFLHCRVDDLAATDGHHAVALAWSTPLQALGMAGTLVARAAAAEQLPEQIGPPTGADYHVGAPLAAVAGENLPNTLVVAILTADQRQFVDTSAVNGETVFYRCYPFDTRIDAGEQRQHAFGLGSPVAVATPSFRHHPPPTASLAWTYQHSGFDVQVRWSYPDGEPGNDVGGALIVRYQNALPDGTIPAPATSYDDSYATQPVFWDADGDGVADPGLDAPFAGAPRVVYSGPGLPAVDAPDQWIFLDTNLAGGHLYAYAIFLFSNHPPRQYAQPAATVGTDADGNWLDDSWEAIYGLTVPDGDADGDGYTNRNEFRLGSSPVDPNDPRQGGLGDDEAIQLVAGWNNVVPPADWQEETFAGRFLQQLGYCPPLYGWDARQMGFVRAESLPVAGQAVWVLLRRAAVLLRVPEAGAAAAGARNTTDDLQQLRPGWNNCQIPAWMRELIGPQEAGKLTLGEAMANSCQPNRCSAWVWEFGSLLLRNANGDRQIDAQRGYWIWLAE